MGRPFITVLIFALAYLALALIISSVLVLLFGLISSLPSFFLWIGLSSFFILSLIFFLVNPILGLIPQLIYLILIPLLAYYGTKVLSLVKDQAPRQRIIKTSFLLSFQAWVSL